MRRIAWLLIALCSAGFLGGCLFPRHALFVPRPR